jgi:flavin reductase (DIM6/NTAB) family NADH-FMN oxidoreductase RutF
LAAHGAARGHRKHAPDRERPAAMLIDPSALERREVMDLVNGLVAPRPIAWVSTVDRLGVRNLAPFSFFNAFSTQPPTVAIGPGSRQGINKDSLRNIKDTREFVLNVVSYELAVRVNQTSAEFPPDVDEWDVAGVTPAPSDDVRPLGVAEAPAWLECRVHSIVDLGTEENPTNSIVVATVTRFHVRDEILDGYRVRPEMLDAVARMGRDLWCTSRDRFELPRPASADPADVRDSPPKPAAQKVIQR